METEDGHAVTNEIEETNRRETNSIQIELNLSAMTAKETISSHGARRLYVTGKRNLTRDSKQKTRESPIKRESSLAHSDRQRST